MIDPVILIRGRNDRDVNEPDVSDLNRNYVNIRKLKSKPNRIGPRKVGLDVR